MGLVEGYEAVDLPLAYPELRAELERDLKAICEGRRDPKVVLAEQIEKYKQAYKVITEKILAMDIALGNRYVLSHRLLSNRQYPMNLIVSQIRSTTTSTSTNWRLHKCHSGSIFMSKMRSLQNGITDQKR